MIFTLFNTPQEIFCHPRMRDIWGRELSHVIKEIYGISNQKMLQYNFAGAFPKLSLINRIRLCYNSYRYRSGLPYEYIWKHTEFWRRKFWLNASVLIPRPETEEWVGRAMTNIRKLISSSRQRLHLLDIGTGSGVIAITLKAEFPEIEVSAIDISSSALRVAKKNARRILSDASHPIRFLHGDVFQIPLKKLLPQRDTFDLIVTNPPYVAQQEKTFLSSKVVKHEPHTALFSGDDGLTFFRRLSYLLPHILSPQGYFYTEMGRNQAGEVKKLFQFFQEKEIVKDMFGKERLFIGGSIPHCMDYKNL